MENLCKHKNKKKNMKILPVAINGGAGGLGMIAGFVLLGGALVTATIVSNLAFRSRNQPRQPEKTKKKKSTSPSLSPETHSEEVVKSMKDIQTNNIQSLAPGKKHDDEQVHSGDSNEAIIKDQENASVRADSTFKSEELDDSCEWVNLDGEEQVIVAAQMEKDSCLERDDGGGEEQKHLMINDNENDEHVDANSFASDKDIVSEASENEDYQKTIFMNEKAATAMEAVCVDQVKVEDNLQVRFLAERENDGHDEIILNESEGDLSDETDYADQIVHEAVTESDAARLLRVEVKNCPPMQLLDCQDEIILENCEGNLSDMKGPANKIMRENGQQMECSGKQVMADDEVAPEMRVNQVCETFVIMNILKEVVADQTIANEGTPPGRSMNKEAKDKETAEKVEEQVVIEDEAVKLDLITEHELVRKDEIPHVESVTKHGDIEENVNVKLELSSGVETNITNNKIEETVVRDKVEMITDHELVKKEEIPHVEFAKENEDSEEEVTVKAELSSVQKEPTPEAKIVYKTEETVEQVKVEIVTDQELVKKDEIQHVESVKEDEEGEENVTGKAELGKVSDYKIEENVKENQTILGKNHNDSGENRVIKEQGFAYRTTKLMAWFVFISVWCLCHWYSKLPFPGLSLVGSLLSILILFGYRNRTTYAVKYI